MGQEPAARVATLGTQNNFRWHTEAPCFTYQFCYDSHRRYTDLHLYKNTYGVGTMNHFKPYVGKQ